LAITALAGVFESGFFSSVTLSSYGYHIAMITDYSIQAVAINAIPLIFAITIHEAAHGYAARRFGDNTAYMLGRVSLNPAKHIDPVGTILIPLVLLLTGSPFLVGYAKPVPVNFGRLRNPRIDSIWVALAGPGSNFIQALISHFHVSGWHYLEFGLIGIQPIPFTPFRRRSSSGKPTSRSSIDCSWQAGALGLFYCAGTRIYWGHKCFMDVSANEFL
jgi:hypothetical protein